MGIKRPSRETDHSAFLVPSIRRGGAVPAALMRLHSVHMALLYNNNNTNLNYYDASLTGHMPIRQPAQ